MWMPTKKKLKKWWNSEVQRKAGHLSSVFDQSIKNRSEVIDSEYTIIRRPSAKLVLKKSEKTARLDWWRIIHVSKQTRHKLKSETETRKKCHTIQKQHDDEETNDSISKASSLQRVFTLFYTIHLSTNLGFLAGMHCFGLSASASPSIIAAPSW